ncbi:MAG: trehalose-phosphatase [Gammaproteobacteria bacterium]
MSTRSSTAGPALGPPPFAPDWAFFLDVDGTLLELAEKPDQVFVDAGLIRVLERLSRGTGGAVALISGRALADLDDLFAPLRPAAAGQHGIERRDHGGVVHYHHQLDGKLDRTRALLTRLAEENPGLLIEDKRYSVAIHYRGAPEKEAVVRAFLDEHMPALEKDFHLQEGKMVFEIKPSGRDKGVAIGEFMQEAPFLGRTPVFIGDDVTDEDGFATVNGLHGHSIRVGDGMTAARRFLPGPRAVLTMLNDYLTYITRTREHQQ